MLMFSKYLDSENYRNSFSKVELTKMNPLYELKNMTSGTGINLIQMFH